VAGRSDEEPEEPSAEESPEAHLSRLLAEGHSVRDASRAVAEASGRPRKELYALAMDLQDRLTRE